MFICLLFLGLGAVGTHPMPVLHSYRRVPLGGPLCRRHSPIPSRRTDNVMLNCRSNFVIIIVTQRRSLRSGFLQRAGAFLA